MRENKVLKDTVNVLTQDTARRSKSRKNWTCYSTKQQQRKRQELRERVSARLVNVDDHFEATSVSFKNRETRELMTVTYGYPSETYKEGSTSNHQDSESAQSTTDMLLYVKEKYGISDKAYHELSMIVSSMPRSCELKKRQLDLNDQFIISPTPDGTIGVLALKIACSNSCSEAYEIITAANARQTYSCQTQCRRDQDWKKATCNEYHIHRPGRRTKGSS